MRPEDLTPIIPEVLANFHPNAVTRCSETFSYDRSIDEIDVEFYTQEYRVSLTIRR